MNDILALSNGLLWAYYPAIAIVLLLIATRYAQLQRSQVQELPGLATGDPAPRFHTEDIRGTTVSIPVAGRPSLIFFANSSCATCYTIMPQVNEFYDHQAERVPTVIVSIGDVARAEHFTTRANPKAPVVADQGLIAGAYRINVSPTAVLVGADGRVVKSTRAATLTVPELLRWLTQADPP